MTTPRFFRGTPVLAALLLTVCLSGSAHPLGKPGAVHHYVLSSDLAARPAEAVANGSMVVRAEFALGPAVGKRHQWFGISFVRQNGRSYSALLLMSAWPRAGSSPDVARYLWREPDWPDYLEYVNEVTGKPEMPRLNLWQYGWPQTADGTSPAALADAPSEIQFHGWRFKFERLSKGEPVIPAQTTVIHLTPDLFVGLAGVHRDVEGRHKQSLGRDSYTYVDPPNEEDWRKEIASGLNLFFQTNGAKQAPWVWRTNCYVSQMFVLPDDWPANLYRSNYWGRSILIDEPAIYNRSAFNTNTAGAGELAPAEVAKALEGRVLEELNSVTNNYGNRILGTFVDRTFGKGSLDLVERKFPAWEAIWQTSWYQLAAQDGVCGLVDEDFYPESLVEAYDMALGIQIPPTIENACALRVAVGRGAARNFHKQWGTAVYAWSQDALNPKIELTALRYLYNAGATYFWHWYGWPGLNDAVVPYSYRMAYASSLRQFFQENPSRDMDALLHAAKVCVVLPDGFTFTPGPLHGVGWLHLERTTAEGATYRQVLRNAGLEAERCIRNGTRFDLAIDEPRFKPHGYDEVIYCRADGSVRVVRTGEADQILPEARLPQRPDLGPLPTVRIEVTQAPVAVPCKFALRGIGEPGTGELSGGLRQEKTVNWEIYTPDHGFLEASGEEASFEAKTAGVYRVRAAVVDCFGRSGCCEASVEVAANRNDISAFPSDWAFQKDLNDTGEAQGWSRAGLDDHAWPRIHVPAGWESAPEVGSYDGSGWYRVRFRVPADAAGKRLALQFEGVDEQGWVWLNGQFVGERTTASTGKSVDAIWDQPFSFDLPDGLAKAGEENLLVVKVHDSTAMGGIFGAVRLVVRP